jgi:hypothetical protein
MALAVTAKAGGIVLMLGNMGVNRNAILAGGALIMVAAHATQAMGPK